MRKLISNVFGDRSGATAIEYGLIAALIAVVIITAVTTVGTKSRLLPPSSPATAKPSAHAKRPSAA